MRLRGELPSNHDLIDALDRFQSSEVRARTHTYSLALTGSLGDCNVTRGLLKRCVTVFSKSKYSARRLLASAPSVQLERPRKMWACRALKTATDTMS